MGAHNVLFEEEGSFKSGHVLSSNDASMQVELASGKRTKVKSAQVVLRFDAPPAGALLAQAQQAAESIDVDFLWECAPQEEFGFEDLAREYHGRAPNAVEAASILLRLHGAPVYFHRKGRGRFRPAPPEILKAALAAVERKRALEAKRQQLVDQLKAGEVPAEIARRAIDLLVRPDRNGIEYKALEQAAAETQRTPLALLLDCGAIASPYHWHLQGFLAQHFPQGTGFGADVAAPPASAPVQGAPGDELPIADVAAFSIDDSSTTEVDDAFSVRTLADGVEVGIHIAAPALAIGRGHPLDVVARARMSTVYAPGLKFTMLPEGWIDAYSLNEGRVVPVVSLYAEVDAQQSVRALRTIVERVRIAANLRHDVLDERVTPERIEAAALDDVPFGAELHVLWKLARALLAVRERRRGRPEPLGRVDYSIGIVWPAETTAVVPDAAAVRDARVAIRTRRRGAPLDLIVAELMILANSHWGGWLAQGRRPAIYRSQSLERVGGRPVSRVRMSTTPAPHDGIGVAHYTWASSPLRRYADLVNQRQIIAAARAEPPVYAANDADLFAIVTAFDAAHATYAEFQERMERYWCLRWLQQENVFRIGATVLRDDVLRLAGLPFVTRLPGLPGLARGQQVELEILGVNLVELRLEARLAQVLAAQEVVADDDADEADDAAGADADDAAAADAGTAGAAAAADASAPGGSAALEEAAKDPSIHPSQTTGNE
jgi:exoribonuclease-2